MADRIPVVTKIAGTGNSGLAEMQVGETTPVGHGGTGATTAPQALSNLGAASQTDLTNHQNNTSNPHNVTPAQIAAVANSSVGQPNGVAALDGGGKVPIAQIPAAAIPSMNVVADATARLALTVQEGDEAKQLDDGSHWIYDGTTWHMYPNPVLPVFGTQFQIQEKYTVQTVVGAGTGAQFPFITYTTMTTGNLPAGTYRVGVYFLWNYDNVSYDFMSRIVINGTQEGEIHCHEPKDHASGYPGDPGSTGTNQRYPAYRVNYPPLSGVSTIELQFKSNRSAVKGSIIEGVIELWRVS